jgi:tetratricopeptide (TPR) repeat protein
MAEVDPTASTASPAAGTRTGNGFELRLERGGAHVRLGAPTAIAGVLVEHLDLKVPDIALPFDAGGGPAQFRNRLCDLDALTVRVDQDAVSASAARLDLGELGLGSLEVVLRDGFAEVGGRLAIGTAFSMRLGLLPGFERGVALVPYAPRLYGPSPMPAAALPHLAARALAILGLPDDPLPLLARRLLVSRGWKVPREGGVRLAAATVAPGGVRLAWAREVAAPPAAPNDPDLLAAVEGSRAFAEAEALVAAGDWAEAREAWLASPAPSTHAFAADRLLSLLCLDDRYHDEALDLAAGWLQRRPGFAPALAAEAWIRAARGEHGRAAAALVTLAEGSVAAGERLAAVAAAEAVLALPGIDQDLMARAVEAALAAKRDHLPSLRALRLLARERGDKGAQIRAARRVLAYAPTDLEKARAHAELGELLLESDPPGARLHLDRALRLAPDDADSLSALARACTAAGEHLRAVGALDRLRALRQRAGDRAGAVDLALKAGAIWDERLGHVENALLRYREAAELGPRAAEAHRLAAGCAERLGRWAEAADHHAAALAALDRTAPGAGALAAAHHLALASVAERHLDDPAGAATHLEAAQATVPLDAAQLSRLAALHRRLGRHAELLHTLDRLAPLTGAPATRAALLAEAGDLARGPLARPDLATGRYAAALQLDPTFRPAIEGLAALAQVRGDGPAERDALLKLVPLARDKGEEASILDRLAAASVRAGDLSAAVRAVGAARRAEPSRERLAAAAGLARRSGDRPALTALLAEQAQAAMAAGDRIAAAAAWRERAELLAESDAALALTALDEARGLHPGDLAMVRLEATLAERVGDHHRALGALRTQLASSPVEDGALELRAARAALAAGELPTARAHAERALAAGVGEAGDVLVGALERSGDRAGQVEALTRAGRHLEAASLAERLGDAPAALRALERAAEGKETAGEALRHLLRIHAAAGDAKAAAAVLLVAASRAGGREGAALAWRAFSLTGDAAALDLAAGADPSFAPAGAERAARRAASDPAAALTDAEAALAGDGLDPARRPELLRLAAELAERTGDRELARRRLAAYCQTGNPTDSELAHLTELHRAANDLDGLATALARRIASAPITEVQPLHLDLARLLVRLGREPEAVESWRAALRFDPVALEPIRALLVLSRAALLHDGERVLLLQMLADHDGASDAERAGAWDDLAEARAAAGDGAGAAEARSAAARRRGDDDEGLDRQALAAAAAGDFRQAARLQLQRARRALAAAEADAPDRLAEAGLALLEAGDVTDGETTLREALGLHPDPERARGALTALAKLAAERADGPAEAQALAALAPLVPTGQRPDLLIRVSLLRAAAGDTAGAFDAAEQARTLAPRTLAAVRQARLAAAAAGDERSVAMRLEEEARLDASEAGSLLLERARRLARLGEAEAADGAYTESLALLQPDQALALEQVRLRRDHLPQRPSSEPLERFAARLGDSTAAARAQAAAAALAWEAGERGAALRCARRAFGRSRLTPALAGPLLARLLYAQGSFAEALVVHRTLLERGFAGFEEAEIVTLSRQLAELASEAQDPALALQAYDRLLALRPQEAGAALERFRIDPDRQRAVAALESVANQVRSRATRVELLAAAAEGALSELHDRRLGERLFREARAEASLKPGLEVALDRRRVAATRLGQLGPAALLGALHDAAEAAIAAGETAAARELLEEAVGEQRARGMKPGTARDLLELEKLLAAEGADGAAAVRAREAAELLAEAGDGEAVPVARRALERDPGGPDGLRWLAAIEARFVPAAAEVTLRRALAEQPGEPAVEAQLLGLLDRESRQGARARLLLDRARRQTSPAARAGLRREAARLLASTGEADDAALAADTLLAVTSDLPQDSEALREAASALMACDRAPEAVRLLDALLRANPDDQAIAEQLERAGGPRRPPPMAPAVDSIEEAFSSQEQRPGPVAGPRTLEFPALERRDAEPPAAELPAEEHEPEQPPEPVPAPAFEAIIAPRTLEFPAIRLPPAEESPASEQTATEPTPLEPAQPGSGPESRDLARLAEAASDPASRASAWLASANAARRAGAPVEEVRQTIELACESEPDAPAPWAALADLELGHGDAIAAARAYLAVSIRTEGVAAADAALVAARLFLEQGHAPEAVRALRAATLGEATSVPPELVQAVEALASSWSEAATRLLALVAPDGLGMAARAVHDQLHLMLDWSAGVLEIADLQHQPELDTEPGPGETAPEGQGLGEPSPEESALGDELAASLDASFGDVLTQPPPAEPMQPAEPVAAAETAIPDWTWDSAESAGSAEPTAPAEATGPPPPGEAEATAEAVTAVEPPAPAPGGADPLLLLLRAEADAASGSERAGALERLAGLLERAGDLGAAADSLMEALAADADRELTWGWLESLVTSDPDRQARVAALRQATAPAPSFAVPPPPVAVPVPPVAASPAESLERALAMARRDPADPDALLEVASLAGRLATTAAPFEHDRLAELARLAGSIAAFVAPGRARAPEAPPLAIALSDSARDRVALPGTIGPLGRLLSLLTPHLEPLFPADLQRLGITAANRLVAPHDPEVREPLETAASLLSARAHATFLVDRPGALITLENTRPPALIVTAGFAALPMGARRFLATRALDQLERGGALVGKFAPRDVGILLELACRFAGGKPPSLGLPAARAGAFLSAMARAVPPVLAARVASLGPPAAEELAGADLGALADSLQRTSARVALLATGDPAGAFAALVATEAIQLPSGAEAIRLPLLLELATLALSEPFLDLRVAVVG